MHIIQGAGFEIFNSLLFTMAVFGPFRKHGTVAVSSTGFLNMIGAAMALLLEPPMRKMEPLPETAAVPCFRKEPL